MKSGCFRLLSAILPLGGSGLTALRGPLTTNTEVFCDYLPQAECLAQSMECLWCDKLPGTTKPSCLYLSDAYACGTTVFCNSHSQGDCNSFSGCSWCPSAGYCMETAAEFCYPTPPEPPACFSKFDAGSCTQAAGCRWCANYVYCTFSYEDCPGGSTTQALEFE